MLSNGNNYWEKAIQKEMDAVEVAFRFNDIGENPPPGYKKITCHLIFDVKFDLTRKARLVAGGHRNKNIPAHATYSSVASRDSVRLCNANISYFKCRYIEHTSRGSTHTLALYLGLDLFFI